MDCLRLNNYAVAFDVEGTLANTFPTHHAARLVGFAEHGFGHITTEQHALGPTYGSTSPDIIGGILFAANAIDNSIPFDQHPTVLAVIKSYKQAFTTMAADGFYEMPGAADFVRDIAAHCQRELALVTSSRACYVTPFLERYNLAQYFAPDLQITKDVMVNDGLKNKPAPDPYLLAKKRLGTQNLIVFEDTVPGVAAAKQADTFVVALCFDEHNTALFKSGTLEHQPDLIVADFAEARSLLGL